MTSPAPGEAFDSVTIGQGATLSYSADSQPTGGLAASFAYNSLRLPRPDALRWIHLRLPPQLWDQVAGVLEAWAVKQQEPFWIDGLYGPEITPGGQP